MNKRISTIILMVLWAAATLFPITVPAARRIPIKKKNPKFAIILYGGAGYVPGSGSASDYHFMQNDFCVKKGYVPFGAGLGIGFNMKSLYAGLEAAFNLGGIRRYEDPVEFDSVAVRMQKSVTSYLVLGLALMKSKKGRLAVQLGGGMDLLLGDQKTYTSANGYRVYIKPRENKLVFAGFLGAAFEHMISRNFGWHFHLRCVMKDAKEFMPALGLGISCFF
ncbi:MAG: hypothetical protein JXI33_01945 [Candidatus Aminicenantes bacterium]|nr:hypothetical protein [Candidatus Aminicenantes bacterium]